MKLKKLALLMLAASVGITAVSCADKAVVEPIVETDKLNKAIDDSSTVVEKRLLSIALETDDVQKVFYIGDVFNHENLKVRATFVEYVGGKRSDKTTTEYPTDFTVDYSEVNLNALGTYPVSVTYRYGSGVNVRTYNVEVKSSKIETTPNIEFVAGLKIRWKNTNTNIKQVGVGEYQFDKADLDYSQIKRSIDSNLKITETESSGRTLASKLVFDDSNYDKDKAGVYVIKITYTNDNIITIDGTPIDYKVVSFVIIEVGNPVKEIAFKSGTQNFAATPNDLDFSDWVFTVTYKDGSTKDINYNKDDFKVDNYNSMITTSDSFTQYADVYYIAEMNNSDKYEKCSVKLNISASTAYNITIYDTLPGFSDPGDTPKDYKFNESDKVIMHAGKGSKCEAPKAKGVMGIDFPNRPTLSTENNGSYVQVTVENEAVIVFYCCSTGTDGARHVELRDAEDNVVGEAEVADKGESDAPVEYRMTVSKAGTYKFYTTVKNIYFYGVVIAEKKVA